MVYGDSLANRNLLEKTILLPPPWQDLVRFPRVLSSSQTWVNLTLEPMSGCNTGGDSNGILIKCGRITQVVGEGGEGFVIRDLFPGRSYQCSYAVVTTNDTELMAWRKFDFETKELPLFVFSSHDTAIFLSTASSPSSTPVILQEGFDSFVRVTDLFSGKEEEEVSAAAAMSSSGEGVTGLRPSTPYMACLVLRQREGRCSFEGCQGQKVGCERITTHAAKSSADAAAAGAAVTRWELAEAAYALLAVILLVVIALAALAWRSKEKRRRRDDDLSASKETELHTLE